MDYRGFTHFCKIAADTGTQPQDEKGIPVAQAPAPTAEQEAEAKRNSLRSYYTDNGLTDEEADWLLANHDMAMGIAPQYALTGSDKAAVAKNMRTWYDAARRNAEAVNGPTTTAKPHDVVGDFTNDELKDLEGGYARRDIGLSPEVQKSLEDWSANANDDYYARVGYDLYKGKNVSREQAIAAGRQFVSESRDHARYMGPHGELTQEGLAKYDPYRPPVPKRPGVAESGGFVDNNNWHGEAVGAADKAQRAAGNRTEVPAYPDTGILDYDQQTIDDNAWLVQQGKDPATATPEELATSRRMAAAKGDSGTSSIVAANARFRKGTYMGQPYTKANLDADYKRLTGMTYDEYQKYQQEQQQARMQAAQQQGGAPSQPGANGSGTAGSAAPGAAPANGSTPAPSNQQQTAANGAPANGTAPQPATQPAPNQQTQQNPNQQTPTQQLQPTEQPEPEPGPGVSWNPMLDWMHRGTAGAFGGTPINKKPEYDDHDYSLFSTKDIMNA